MFKYLLFLFINFLIVFFTDFNFIQIIYIDIVVIFILSIPYIMEDINLNIEIKKQIKELEDLLKNINGNKKD